MNADKGTVEERGAPGVTKGNKRPGFEQVHRRRKEHCKRPDVQSAGIMNMTGRVDGTKPQEVNKRARQQQQRAP